MTTITTSDQRLLVKSLQHQHFPEKEKGGQGHEMQGFFFSRIACGTGIRQMKELLYTHCSWCLRSMEGIAVNEAFTLAEPFSDQLKARARRTSTSYLVPLAGKEIPTLIQGSGDGHTAQWVLCRQECSDALAEALREEFRPNSTTHFTEPESTLDIGIRQPLTLSLDADLFDLIESKAVREKRNLTDITEELYRKYLTQGFLPDWGSGL